MCGAHFASHSAGRAIYERLDIFETGRSQPGQLPTKFLGHPVYQLLIVFPLGLLATAVIFDLIYLAGGMTMALISYWMTAAGNIGGLFAAPLGWIDWFGIPSRIRAKSVGLWHGGNLIVIFLFAGVGSCDTICPMWRRWCFRSWEPGSRYLPAGIGDRLGVGGGRWRTP